MEASSTREEDLYPFIQVSGHPVGATHVDLFLAVVEEVEDPGVLQEIADQGADADVLTDPRNSHFQTADSADDQLHFYPCCGSFIKSCDDLLIAERIHLRNDMRRFSLSCIAGFPADQADKFIP